MIMLQPLSCRQLVLNICPWHVVFAVYIRVHILQTTITLVVTTFNFTTFARQASEVLQPQPFKAS